MNMTKSLKRRKKCLIFNRLHHFSKSVSLQVSQWQKDNLVLLLHPFHQSKLPVYNQRLGDVRNMNPTIDLKQNPTNDLQKWAVGTVFKTVHQGANKCLSNAAVVENYEIGYEMVNEYHNTIKSSYDQLRKIPPPLKGCLNCHNILDVQKAI